MTTKLANIKNQLADLETRRQALRAEINSTPDTQSTTDRENALLVLCRQIDRLAVYYGSEFLSAKLA